MITSERCHDETSLKIFMVVQQKKSVTAISWHTAGEILNNGGRACTSDVRIRIRIQGFLVGFGFGFRPQKGESGFVWIRIRGVWIRIRIRIRDVRIRTSLACTTVHKHRCAKKLHS